MRKKQSAVRHIVTGENVNESEGLAPSSNVSQSSLSPMEISESLVGVRQGETSVKSIDADKCDIEQRCTVGMNGDLSNDQEMLEVPNIHESSHHNGSSPKHSASEEIHFDASSNPNEQEANAQSFPSSNNEENSLMSDSQSPFQQASTVPSNQQDQLTHQQSSPLSNDINSCMVSNEQACATPQVRSPNQKERISTPSNNSENSQFPNMSSPDQQESSYPMEQMTGEQVVPLSNTNETAIVSNDKPASDSQISFNSNEVLDKQQSPQLSNNIENSMASNEQAHVQADYEVSQNQMESSTSEISLSKNVESTSCHTDQPSDENVHKIVTIETSSNSFEPKHDQQGQTGISKLGVFTHQESSRLMITENASLAVAPLPGEIKTQPMEPSEKFFGFMNSKPVPSEDVEISPQDYQLNEHGVGRLPDGTIVVQPKPVEEEEKSHQTRSHSKNGHGPTNTTAAARKGNNNTDSLAKLLAANPRPSTRNNSTSRPVSIPESARCTRCLDPIDVYKGDVHVHPSLEVLLCKRCFQLYMTNRNFEKDPSDNKDSQCRWCVGYGDLFCCDVCDNSFCRRCIKRNLGRAQLSYLQSLSENDTWRCYMCDPSPLEAQRDLCRKMVDAAALLKPGHLRRDQRLSSSRSQLSTNSSETKSDVVLLEDSDSAESDVANTRDGSEALLAPTAGSNNSAITLRVARSSSSNGITPASSTNSEETSSQSPIATLLTQLHSHLFKKPAATPSSQNKSTPSNAVVSSNIPSESVTSPHSTQRSQNTHTPSSTVSLSRQDSSSSKSTSRASTPSTNVEDDYENITMREGLKWLDDSTQLRTNNLTRFVDASLRSVAQFYQDLRRLQMSMQKEDSEIKRKEYLMSYKETFRTNIRDRLFKLPHRMNESGSTSTAVTQNTPRAAVTAISSSTRAARTGTPVNRVTVTSTTSSSAPSVSLSQSSTPGTLPQTPRSSTTTILRTSFRPTTPKPTPPRIGLVRPTNMMNETTTAAPATAAVTSTTSAVPPNVSLVVRPQTPASQRVAPVQTMAATNPVQNPQRPVVGVTNGRATIKAPAKRTFTIDLTDDDDEPSSKINRALMPVVVSNSQVPPLSTSSVASISQTSNSIHYGNSIIQSNHSAGTISIPQSTVSGHMNTASTIIPQSNMGNHLGTSLIQSTNTVSTVIPQGSISGHLGASLIPTHHSGSSVIAATMVPILMDPMMASSFPVLTGATLNHRTDFPDQRVLLASQNFSLTPRTPEISHVVSVPENTPHSPGNDSDNSIDLGVSTITEEDP